MGVRPRPSRASCAPLPPPLSPNSSVSSRNPFLLPPPLRPANVGHSSHMSHRPEQRRVCCRPQRAAKVCVGGWGVGGREGGGGAISGKTAGSPTSAETPRRRSVRTNGVASGSPQNPPRGSFLDSPVPGLLPLSSEPLPHPAHTKPIGQENEKERAGGGGGGDFPKSVQVRSCVLCSRRGRMKPRSHDLEKTSPAFCTVQNLQRLSPKAVFRRLATAT